MGGVSESGYQIDPKGGENGQPIGIFKGLINLVQSQIVYPSLYLLLFFKRAQ